MLLRSTVSLSLALAALAGSAQAQQPGSQPTAHPAVPAAPAAPAPAGASASPSAAPATPSVNVPKPALKADKEGYCQNSEFIAWSKDGTEAAYAESYCKQPPPDAAYDTLFLVTRQGKIKRWLIGAEAGADMKADTRAKLLYGEPFRKAGAKSPVKGGPTAQAKVEGDHLVVTFKPAAKDQPEPAAVSREIALPYKDWPMDKAPTVGDVYWSPDGGALAVTVKGTRKEPGGGKLNVAQVQFIEIAPPPPPAPPAAPPTPTAPAPGAAPAVPPKGK